MQFEGRILMCPECERVASIGDGYNARPICVHSDAGGGGAPEIWDGDDVDGEGRTIEMSPAEVYRTPGPNSWSEMVPWDAAKAKERS